MANFGIAVLVARAGAAFAGVFFAVTAIVAIAGNAASLGTMTSLVYFMPNATGGGRGNPRSLIVIATVPVVVAGALAGTALAASAGSLAGLVAADQADDAAGMLRVLAVTVPAWAITLSLLGATRGLGTMTPTVAINQIFKPLTQLGAIALLLEVSPRPSLALLALAWGAPVVVAVLLALVAVHALGGFAAPSSADGSTATMPTGPLVSPAEYWRYTRPRSVATAVQIALERIDVVIVSAIAGEAAAGVYGTITRFITAGNFLIHSVGQATTPALRRAISAERWDDAQRLLGQATSWMVAVAAPYFLFVAVDAESFIALLEPGFVEGATALTILAVAMLAHAVTGPIDLALLMLGRSMASLGSAVGALAIDIGLAIVLVPRHGLVGAAIAWALAVVAQNAIAVLLVARSGRLRPFSLGGAIALLGAVVAMAPVVLIEPAGLTRLVLAGGAAGIVYVAWLASFAEPIGVGPPHVRRLGAQRRQPAP